MQYAILPAFHWHCLFLLSPSESWLLHNICDGTIPDIYTPLIRLHGPFNGYATLTISIVNIKIVISIGS